MKNMEWRIRESANGYHAERGCRHDGGVKPPIGNGYTMPAFIVYELARFDTMEQAKRYIKNRGC